MAILKSHPEISRCPHCGVSTPNLYLQHELDTTSHSGQNKRFWRIYKCSKCGGVVTAASNTKGGQVLEMYPSSTELNESIPQTARTYLTQALNSAEAPAGAVMLAASAVDAMLKAKNYKEGSLYSRINKAKEDGLITEGMAKWAHDVRLDANDQRHADEEATLPNENDAKKCTDFALALAQF